MVGIAALEACHAIGSRATIDLVLGTGAGDTVGKIVAKHQQKAVLERTDDGFDLEVLHLVR